MNMSVTDTIELSKVVSGLSIENDVPNFRALSAIEIEPDQIGAEKALSRQSAKVITDSINTIENIAIALGLEPLIVDISLIMDQELRGLSGEYGFYHSFFSINTENHADVSSAYMKSIFAEHRGNQNADEFYESIVTHSGLFAQNRAALVSPISEIWGARACLPAFLQTDHVGAYGFSVRYVAKHKTKVETSIEGFLENFCSELVERIDSDCEDEGSECFLLTLPLRRAKFSNVGELAKLENPKTGTPGGSVFLFLRGPSGSSQFETDSILGKLVRRLTWILGYAAVGEANGPSAEKKAQIDQATATYGLAHPLKERWGGVARQIDALTDEVIGVEKPDFSYVARYVQELRNFKISFGGWIELAYLLYYAGASTHVDQASFDPRIRGKVFSGTDSFDVLAALNDRKSVKLLLGDQRSRHLNILTDSIKAASVSSVRRGGVNCRLSDAIFNQIVFEILSNSYKHSERGQKVEVKVSGEVISGRKYLVFSNKTTKLDRISKSIGERWMAWPEMQQPGGMSFISRLLRWTNSGDLMVKTDESENRFSLAIRWRGLVVN